MTDGVIVKALSGFYYVETEGKLLECKARGKFRLDGTSPLVGDRVSCSLDANGKGRIDHVEPRRNWFIRPAVANVDMLVFVAANTNPVTDPFLIDRVSVIAAEADCEFAICVNKTDIDAGDELFDVFTAAGFPVIRTSAVTGEGMDELRGLLCGKISAFTGNSGVGKSSILNALFGGHILKTGNVSEKLGRGKHTTRHTELFYVGDGGFVADTPGFSSFDYDSSDYAFKENLIYCFRDLKLYADNCRFTSCTHTGDGGCGVIKALQNGEIEKSRFDSYKALFNELKDLKPWNTAKRK